jgi:hypothetical protein
MHASLERTTGVQFWRITYISYSTPSDVHSICYIVIVKHVIACSEVSVCMFLPYHITWYCLLILYCELTYNKHCYMHHFAYAHMLVIDVT